MQIGILTNGGDCPGLNAVIRAIVRKGERTYGDTIYGFHDGYLGLVEQRYRVLDISQCRGSLPKGGTMLGTSRSSPLKIEGGREKVKETVANLGLDALLVLGGEGSLSVARVLWEEDGIPIVGVPKTIDNDLQGTQWTFGFHTAVQIATDVIDRLHTTAESHDRVMVVEVMGRHVGWIAMYAGVAGGATEILVPEKPFDMNVICDRLRKRHDSGRFASIVVVAEGALPKEGTIDIPPQELDKYGHVKLGGIAGIVAREIEDRTGFETRVTVIGHVQRGGTPTAYDRVLATRFGVAAADAVHRHEYGQMVALREHRISTVPLAEATEHLKTVPDEFFEEFGDGFFGG